MNPYNHARNYQAQLERKTELQRTAHLFFGRGVKAAAKAAQELVSEGLDKTSDFETLVIRRVDENRKRKAENQNPSEAS